MTRGVATAVALIASVSAVWCGTAGAAVWFSDSFDSYNTGNLAPQGGWTSSNPSKVRVESAYARSGKAVETNCKVWGYGETSHNTSSGGGYQTIDVWAAMDVSATTPPTNDNVAYIKFFNETGREITCVYYSYQKFKVLLYPADRITIQEGVTTPDWYHIRLGLDLTNSKVDVWVNDVQKITAGPAYNSGASISRIAIGCWNVGSEYIKTETYVDDIVCDSEGGGGGTSNVILSPYTGWESINVCYPCVFYDNSAGVYKMYYSGSGGASYNESAWSQWQMGLATSADKTNWTRWTDTFQPVFYARRFMEGDVVDPTEMTEAFDSVSAFGAWVMKDDATYKIWYTGWTGETEHVGGGVENKIKRRIGYATSTDGITWVKYTGGAGAGAIIGQGMAGSNDWKGACHPCVLKLVDGTYKVWYEGFGSDNVSRICAATSIDGFTWSTQGVALSPGSGANLDALGVRNPVVIMRNGHYELWYQGQSSASPYYHILRATSGDGTVWTKAPGEVSLHPVPATADPPWNGNGPDAKAHVGSIIVNGDGTCEVFYGKQCVRYLTKPYGSVREAKYFIFKEVVNP